MKLQNYISYKTQKKPILVLAGLFLLTFVYAGPLLFVSGLKSTEALPNSGDIVHVQQISSSTVKYTYISNDLVPAREFEDISRRTDQAYVQNLPGGKERVTFTTGKEYRKKDDNWYALAEATTSVLALESHLQQSVWFTEIAFAESTTTSYTTSGTSYWVAPTGVTSVDVACWGAGGGGGDGANAAGGGGGGGAFASSTVSVTPGTSYPVVVGAGGAANEGNGGSGSAGATSTFATTTVVAAGGQAGSGANAANAAGGSGGLAASSTGDVTYSGGNGGGGTDNGDTGGGGGGAAGPHGAGGNGLDGEIGGPGCSGAGGAGDNGQGGAGGVKQCTNATAGDPGTDDVDGGGGGAGGENQGKGGAGGAPGGGGGGGENGSGVGADGQCTITYDEVYTGPLTITSAADQAFAVGDSATAISLITVRASSTQTSISAANDLRIVIATSTVNMLWDTSDTTAVFGGTASANVSNPVSYEGGGSILVIPVDTDFATSSTLTISGLSFTSFTTDNTAVSALSVRTGGLGDTTDDAVDTKTVTIETAASTWDATNWTSYDTLTIDATKIDATLTDFPVYVNLADLSSAFWSTTPSASTTVGTDIRVTTDDSSPVELPRELVFASSTTQTGELHFKADSISSTTDTVFRIYYNGTTTGDYNTAVTYGAQNVWTNNYRAVWHFEQNLTGAVDEVLDSTANGYHGTSSAMDSTDVVTGKLGGNSYSFGNGSLEYINMGDPSDGGLDFVADQQFTVSFWGKSPNGDQDKYPIYKRNNTGYRFVHSAGANNFNFEVDEGAAVQAVTVNETEVFDDTWRFLVGGRTATELFFYNNLNVATTADSTLADLSDTQDFLIGGLTLVNNEWDGEMDEVRIASTSRSTAWLKAEYYNQATTTDFYTAAEFVPAITLSGTLYSDEGSTAITSGKTIKVAVGTSTPSLHTTTSNGSGNFTFTIPNANLTATNTPLVVWVDGDSVKANTFSKLASTTANLTGVNLYENHVIVRHEDAGSIASTTVTTDDMSFYDANDDSDIQYTASSTLSESFVVYPGNELYIWPNNNLVPVQSLTIHGNAGSGNDGSLELTAGSGLWMATGTLSIAGNLTMAQTSNLVAPASGILFTATTTGKTIETPLDATVTDTLGSLVFNGAGGGWTIATSATTTNFTITNGSVTLASGVDLVVTEDFTNSGTFTNNGELIIGPGEGWNTADAAFIVGSGKSVSSYGSNATNLDFSPDGTKLYYASNADTRVNQFTLTTPWDVSTLSSNVTFNISGQGAGWSIVMVPDGKSFYVSSSGVGGVLYRYVMSTAWDISTAAYTGESFSVSGNNEFEFSPDGTKLYHLAGEIITYNLSTPWLVTDESATISHRYNINSDASADYNGMHISNDGTKLYTVERTTEYVHAYNLSVPWSIATSSLTYLGPQLYVGGQELNVREIEMNNDGTRAYIVGNGLVIYTYELYEQPQTLSGTLTGSAALGDVITKNASSTTFSNNASTTNLTINGTTTAPTVLSIAGDYTNNSIFQANNGEVVFDGSAQQTLSGVMTGSSTFYNLTLNNTSQNGSTNQSVVFGASASTTNTMTMEPDSSAAFAAGAGYTFQNVDWAGSSGSPVWLRSTTPGSKWYLDIPGSQLNVTYVDVQDSDATQTSGGVTPTYSTNSGRNTNWNFSIPTWNAINWNLYDTITIDAANIDEDLTDFPVYVNLADLSATFWSTTPTAASLVGTDIRVTTDDGSPVELPRELVVASSTAQTGELHFKADSISSTTDTVFRIYYNGTTTGDYLITDTYGAQNVWTNDYRSVWHFEQNLTGATDEVLDSTANGYHGVSSAMDSTDVVTGKLGGNSYSFGNGSLEYINMGDPSDGGLDFVANQTFTISFWGSSTDPAADEYALSKRNATGYQFIHSDPGGTFNWRIDEGGSNVNNTIADTSVLDGTWRYLVGGRSTTESFLYNNLSSTTVSDTSLADLSETDPFVVGAVSTSGGGGWDGEIDEVRVASTSRSNAWIKAEYYNQATTTDFYTTEAVAISGSSTIANHDSGQVNNAFNFQNKTNEALFAFKITPNSGNATVTDMTVSLSGAKKITTTDFTNIRLYRDTNNDAAYDGGDVLMAGSGSMVISGQLGSVTFTTDFAIIAAANYILVADWNAPPNGSFLVFDLLPSDVTIVDDVGTQTVYGSVDDIQHSRNNRGGGGSTAEIGDAPPATTPVTGGGAGGGGEIDTNTGGATIGNATGFFWPTANSGSWTNAANAYDQADGTYATDNAGATNNYTSYGFGVPGSNQITGVEVKMEISGTTAAGTIGVELSWNGGTSWTSSKSSGTLTTTDAVVSVGGSSDLWGRTWSVSEFSNANFAVRLTGNPSSNTVQVDAIQVRVYHQTTGGGGGGGGEI